MSFRMLSAPSSGWVSFQLLGTNIYELSYLDDIPFEWVEQAINGLRTDSPFVVRGNLEPTRFLCLVSYYNCHIIMENERDNDDAEGVMHEYSHTGMLSFCQSLHDDIKNNLDSWVQWLSSRKDNSERERALTEQLDILQELIDLKSAKGFTRYIG